MFVVVTIQVDIKLINGICLRLMKIFNLGVECGFKTYLLAYLCDRCSLGKLIRVTEWCEVFMVITVWNADINKTAMHAPARHDVSLHVTDICWRHHCNVTSAGLHKQLVYTWQRSVLLSNPSHDYYDNKSNSVLRKISGNALEIVSECKHFFRIELPSVQLVRRFEKFSCNVILLVDYRLCRPAICVYNFCMYFVRFSISPSICLMSLYLCCCSSVCLFATTLCLKKSSHL